jgi:hypothetical protein
LAGESSYKPSDVNRSQEKECEMPELTGADQQLVTRIGNFSAHSVSTYQVMVGIGILVFIGVDAEAGSLAYRLHGASYPNGSRFCGSV